MEWEWWENLSDIWLNMSSDEQADTINNHIYMYVRAKHLFLLVTVQLTPYKICYYRMVIICLYNFAIVMTHI